jgi:hypothetical protein
VVLAKEDLSNYVEEEALMSTHAKQVCKFILEDIIARHGSFYWMKAYQIKLDAEDAAMFFAKFNIKLNLSASTYNPEANGKSKRDHLPIVSALVKSCNYGKTH